MSDDNLSTDNGSPDEPVRVAAYFKWLNAGRPDGRDLDFWCEAEHEYTLLQCAAAHPSADGAPAHREVMVRPKALPSPARLGKREKQTVTTSQQKV